MSTLKGIQDLLVQKFDIPEADITPDSTLSDLGLDSLSIAELSFDVEDAFRVRLPGAIQVRTVGDMAALVDSLRDPAGVRLLMPKPRLGSAASGGL